MLSVALAERQLGRAVVMTGQARKLAFATHPSLRVVMKTMSLEVMETSPGPVTKPRILVVDDDELDRRQLRRMLCDGEDDFVWLEADSCERATQLDAESSPDLILLDHLLPDGTGLEWLAERRARCPGPQPVVILTGIEDQSVAEQAMELDAQDYLIKGVVSGVTLRFTICMALQRLRLLAENERAKAEAERARDSAERAARAKQDFLATMSHELRTPLTAVLGFSDVLLEDCSALGCERSGSRETIQRIRRNGEHLLEIVNEVLDLAKIDAGEMQLDCAPCEPVVVVAKACEMMVGRAGEKGLALMARAEGTIPQCIDTDATRVRQILVNLIGNAIKFTSSGSVEVLLRYRGESGSFCGSDGELDVEVCDTGIGLSAEQATRLFQPFVQAEQYAETRFSGTGLGLTICRRLAGMLDGRVELASSRLGQGSTFRLTLPVASGADLFEPKPGDFRAQAGPSLASLDGQLTACRVLLAEDSPDNQRLVRYLLERAGASVEVVDNGKQAVDAIAACSDHERSYDVVVMDLQMPVMSGLEATRRLRASGYQGPIMALTASAMAADRAASHAAGCTAYAVKPIDRRAFLEEMRICLAQHVG